MLRWAVIFLAVAIAAAAAATLGLDGPAMSLAKRLFFAALALFVVFVGLAGVSRRPI